MSLSSYLSLTFLDEPWRCPLFGDVWYVGSAAEIAWMWLFINNWLTVGWWWRWWWWWWKPWLGQYPMGPTTSISLKFQIWHGYAMQIICICPDICAFSVLDNRYCADICTICQKCQFEVGKAWPVLLLQSKA